MSGVTVSRAAFDAMQRAVASDPLIEHCGLLLGQGGAVDTVTVAANVAAQPERRFEIDPAALFAALREERAGGPGLLGYWHSHPSGSAEPSLCDAAMAEPDGRIWIILSRGEAKAWRAVPDGAYHGRFEPLALWIAA